MEFTDEWSEHKFENIFDIKNGLNKGKDYFGEGIRILNYMDVNKYELNTENTIKGLVELTDDEIERYSVKPNDLFFTRTSETSEEIGLTSAYMGNTIKCVFSGFLLRARPKIDLNSLFFAYYLRSPRQRNNIIKFSSITTRALISGGNLSKMKIKYPSIEEQNKIANLFLILDKKVELLEKKYREYQCFKKYLMQKLFAQELRFNFTDEWEKYLLGDISLIGKGFTPSTSNPSFWDGDLKWLSIADMNQGKYINQTTKKITSDGSKNKEPVKKCTLLMSFKLSIGKLGILTEDMYTNEAICNFKWKNKDVLTEYMYYYLSSINILKYGSQATKGITLNNETLSTIPVLLPSLEEQKKIINILSDVDMKINMLENSINDTSKFKKGLLQQMFVVQLILSLLQNKKHI